MHAPAYGVYRLPSVWSGGSYSMLALSREGRDVVVRMSMCAHTPVLKVNSINSVMEGVERREEAEL